MPTDKPKLLERQFVWDVFNFLEPEKATKYLKDVKESAKPARVPKGGTTITTLPLAADMIDLLLQYDHVKGKSNHDFFSFKLFYSFLFYVQQKMSRLEL